MKEFIIKHGVDAKTHCNLFVIDDTKSLKTISHLNKNQQKIIKNNEDKKLHYFNDGDMATVLIVANKTAEETRKLGYQFFKLAKAEKLSTWNIYQKTTKETNFAFLEGFLLSSYYFDKYQTKKNDFVLNINIAEGINKTDLKELLNIVESTFTAKTLINEPQVYLNATQYSKEIKDLSKKHGFKHTVWNKDRIIKEKMGGILAVNKGSIQEPTFNILEYKGNANSENWIVLVGKGITYDTGGLSLKPTANSMDFMKSDMGGSAAVVGAISAIASNKLNINVVGLIPATDNRPGLDAIAPGDVITMYSGKTVEVLNTDAEGRLVLADALHYAKKYKPELVIDLATLTGAAARAIGKEGIVCMGNADEKIKNELKESGNNVYERLVEFPLWEEYEGQIKSDIADIKNLGGATAGATTAGIFLQHFVDYPWMHFDIAGPAYLHSEDNYRGKNGTGVGVRLLYNFIKNRSLENAK
ncbi:MAG: leucyl aminopeptidase family protein [Chitinophagales bacterium]|nr:leucyl aminopeptidase family protein [Chitinophagales bacterium]